MKSKISLMKTAFALCSLFLALNLSAQSTPQQLALASSQNIETKSNQLMQVVDNQDIANILNDIQTTVSAIQSNLNLYADQIDLSNIAILLQEAANDFGNISNPTTSGLNSIANKLTMAKNDLFTKTDNYLNGGVIPCYTCGSNANSKKNYIRTKTYTSANTLLEQTQYFDGLGRANQLVLHKITPSGDDLVSITEYAGEKQRQYLPVKIDQKNGNFVDFQSVKTAANTMYNDSRPYVETKSENRTVTVTGAGEYYQNNPAKQKTELNSANEVKKFKIQGANLVADGYYPANTLYKTTAIDEDSKTAAKFTNKFGEVVMTTQGTENQTCYVYDDFGLLCYVLPPLAVDDNSKLDEYAYFYKYDELGRLTYKKLPGAGAIFMVYDKANRLILAQDSLQRENNEWVYTKYDEYGRILYTGICTTTLSHEDLQENFNEIVVEETTANSDIGYTQEAFSGININYDKFLSVNYYDDYEFLNLPMFSQISATLYYDPNSPLTPSGGTASPLEGDLGGFGLPTGKVAYILDNSGKFLTTAIYYNAKGQAVQTRSTNHLDGFDVLHSQYNFTGAVTNTLKEHSASPITPTGGTVTHFEGDLDLGVRTERYSYEYDHAGRIKQTNYSLDYKPYIILAKNTFDNLGRVTQKNRHSFQQPDIEKFEYNIKSRITKIQSGGLVENLSYNGLYNGNISSISVQNHKYNFKYDELNRLTEGRSNVLKDVKGSVFDEIFTYDKHGNIETLERKSNNIVIDDLKMTYNGNQLSEIQDLADNKQTVSPYTTKQYNQKPKETGVFEYDGNGNLIKDTDRKILSIQYNILNLPSEIEFENGSSIKSIKNIYAADGRKLSSYYLVQVTPTLEPLEKTKTLNIVEKGKSKIEIDNGTHYIGNFEYLLGEKGVLETTRIHNTEGYVENDEWYYYRKDHLGNNREVVKFPSAGGAGVVVQENRYYPSGLPWAYTTDVVQPYLHGGKEFVEMGLDVYDLGFRAYYPAIGRFTTIDPMAERFYSQSPYVYAANNPVRYIDFLGLYPLGDGFPNWGEGSIPVNFPTGNYNLTVMGPRIGENGEYIIGGGGGFGGISMPGGFSLNWQNYHDHEAWIRANRFNRFVENLSKWNPLYKPIDPSKPNHEHSIITTPLDLILTGGGENIPFWFGGTNKFGDLKGPHLHYTLITGSGQIIEHDPTRKNKDGSYDDRIMIQGKNGLELWGYEAVGEGVDYSSGYIGDKLYASCRGVTVYGTRRYDFEQGYHIMGTGSRQGMERPTARRSLGVIDMSDFGGGVGMNTQNRFTRFLSYIVGAIQRLFYVSERVEPIVQQMATPAPAPEMINTIIMFRELPRYPKSLGGFSTFIRSVDTIIPAADTLKYSRNPYFNNVFNAFMVNGVPATKKQISNIYNK